MINGIKPNPMVGDFDKAMDRLVENINKYIIILVSLLCFLLLGIDGFPFIILFYISYSFFNGLFHRNNSK